MDSQNPDAVHIWSTGEYSQIVEIFEEGLYTIKVFNCKYTVYDSINISIDFPLPEIHFGNDTTICNTDSLYLDSGYSGSDIFWSTGDTTQSIFANHEGQYFAFSSNICGSVGDTIDLFVDSLLNPINLGLDQTLCEGESIILNANNAHAEVIWSTGSIEQELAISISGEYFIEVSNACGELFDTINIEFTPLLNNVDLGENRLICDDSNVLLDAGEQNADYSWSTGDTTQSIIVNQGGLYFVIVSNMCDTIFDMISLQFAESLEPIDFGLDTVFCQGDSIELIAEYRPGEYLWSTGDTVQSIFVDTEGTYTLTISNICGSVSDEIFVAQRDTLKMGVIVPCEGGDMMLLCLNDDLPSYNWTGPNGITLSGQYPIIENVTTADNGIYHFILTDTLLCGCGIVHFMVREYPEISINIFDETCVLAEDGIIEIIIHSGVKNYIAELEETALETDKDTITFSNLIPGLYPFVFYDAFDCPIDDTLKISPAEKICVDNTLYIPDAFTPNGDGINDNLIVFGNNIYYFHMEIFDIWNEKMFVYENTSYSWDGTFGGKLCKQGMYGYYAYVFFNDGSQEIKTGHIYLIR